MFDPIIQWINNIVSFFTQVRSYISNFLSFLWDLISWIYYSFNTIISYMAEFFSDFIWLTFFADNSFVLQLLNSYMWSSVFTMFWILLFLCMSLIVIRFVFSLIPFFHTKK